MKRTIFKAYDVRGRYPSEINGEIISKIVGSLGNFFKKGRLASRGGDIIIGHDVRLSSPSLYRAVIRKLTALDLPSVAVGLTTTPMFYFLVNRLQAAGGVMITASHNPGDYNGLKVVGVKAEMIGGAEILEMIDA